MCKGIHKLRGEDLDLIVCMGGGPPCIRLWQSRDLT